MKVGVIMVNLSMVETKERLIVIIHGPQIRVNGRTRLNYALQNRQQNLSKIFSNNFKITDDWLMGNI